MFLYYFYFIRHNLGPEHFENLLFGSAYLGENDKFKYQGGHFEFMQIKHYYTTLILVDF